MSSNQSRKTIPGFPDYEITKEGRVFSKETGKELKPFETSDGGAGYLRVSLRKGAPGSDFSDHYVHKLVMTTFVGPVKSGQVIDHKDRDVTNNSLSNLKYMTATENAANRDNSKQGVDRLSGKEIKEAIKGDKTAVEVAKKLGVTARTIRRHLSKAKKGDKDGA
jgi:DNA-binding CsgD family transcriptional regulator